ncbi:MAG: cation-translocating P-type ATPase [Bacteroidetes bacterium]|nr:cation-translocating P-type ATPase [Bacteroidota bacterium]
MDVDLQKIQGLTDEAAAQILSEHGYNELAGVGRKSFARIVIDVIREPMFLLLLSCGILYLFLGSITESISLVVGILFIMGVTFYQERKTERALDELKKLASPKAMVIRNGARKKIPGREVVPGDVIVISEGNNIPADALLLQSSHLLADESILTGEAVPVRKSEYGNVSQQRSGGEDSPYIYSGTMVVKGTGLARVLATGQNSQVGKIGRSLGIISEEKTALQHEIKRLVRIMAISGILSCLLLVLVYYFTKGNFLNGLLAGLALAMAMIPEEFPVVFTVFMALGAWRMSRRHVLVRKPTAVEALGTVTVLCTDKTGTITENKMQVSKLYVAGEYYDFDQSRNAEIPEVFHEVVEYGILASRNDPFDPMERSIQQLGELKLSGTEHIHRDWTLLREYPLSTGLLSMSMAYQTGENKDHIVAAKGAPEAILQLCRLPDAEHARLSAAAGQMAERGLRVLGIAKARVSHSALPDTQEHFEFSFCGFLGLADPIRGEIPAAIKSCYEAGIRVIIITGDYPATAQSIAAQAGIRNHSEVISGDELDAMSAEVLSRRIRSVNVFARIRPEQKLKIVDALKHSGEIVAMTGDGVNDALALKAAHVGISMGEKGTDVARAASSLVLLDDNFASIVAAIRMGRKIFENLQNAFSYILAIHIPIAGLALIPAVIPGLPILLWPIHIAFHELVIDPMSSVVYEQQEDEKNIMQRPPRSTREPFFDRKKAIFSVVQGFIVLAITLSVYFIGYSVHLPEKSLRAIAFISLVLINLALAVSNLSRSRSVIGIVRQASGAAKWIIGATCILLLLIFSIPYLRAVFMFQLFPFSYWLLIAGATVFALLLFDAMKFGLRRKWPLH